MASSGEESDRETEISSIQNEDDATGQGQNTQLGAQIALPVRPSRPVEHEPEQPQDEEESQESAHGDDGDVDYEYEDRETRFQGPSSTWRKCTQEERQLIASLDQQRANDLSFHLHNAHSLKTRSRKSDVSDVKPWRRKRNWIQPDESGDLPWYPDKDWTAWPLPAAEVPRKDEKFGAPPPDDEDTYQKLEPWVPSLDLRDEIFALLLSNAKKKFRQRRWVSSADAKQPLDEKDEQSQEEPEEGEKPFVSRRSSFSDHEGSQKPALLADEEQSEAILRSSMRHIMAKFDDLLLGLHKSRKGHRRLAFASRSRPEAKASQSRSQYNARPDRNTSRGRSDSRHALASNSEDSHSEFSPSEEEEEEEASISESSDPEVELAKKKRRPCDDHRGPRLGLRDWSEVLGIAALVGWDPAVIDRAAKRCSSLFGESMSFRTMPETVAGCSEDKVAEYAPDTIPSVSDSEAEKEYDAELTAVKGLFCPFKACARHHQAFTKQWRWREHLKRTHKLTIDEVDKIETKHLKLPDAANDVDSGSPAVEAVVAGEDADEDMLGGVHRDGFLQPIPDVLGRGRDVRTRRRRSTGVQQVSKRRRVDEVEHDTESANAE
jgi:hypothetical protein